MIPGTEDGSDFTVVTAPDVAVFSGEVLNNGCVRVRVRVTVRVRC